MSIKTRILVPMIALAIGFSALTLGLSLLLYRNSLATASYDRNHTATLKIEREIGMLLNRANMAAIGVAGNPALAEAFRTNDREKMILTAHNLRIMARLDFFTLVDGEGNVLVRTHEPENTGGNLSGLSNVKSALEGRIETHIVPGATVRIGAMSGAPVHGEDGGIVGAVSLGYRLDTQGFVHEMKGVTGREISFFLGDERISTTLLNPDGSHPAGEKAPAEISRRVLAGERYIGEITSPGGNAMVQFIPLLGKDDAAVGMVAVGEYSDENDRKLRDLAINGLLVMPGALVVCALIALWVAGTLERQINKAREAAETANKAKTVFLVTMSHEIRTPMNSIMGFTELALSAPERELPSDVRGYLLKIRENSGLLMRLINDILDISKIESEKMELERAPFDLGRVLARCQSIIMPSIREKSLDLRVYAESLEGMAPLGDSLKLTQALMNLLSNAVKFTEKGTIRLAASVLRREEHRARVRFEVRDSGVGIDPDKLSAIFEPFVQANSSTTREYGGTGLGLAIVRKIVELMGGELRVESHPGFGSQFSFEVEFETIDSSEVPSAPIEAPVDEKPRFRGLALVCDDNRMNREVIAGHLDQVGIQADFAENGLEAVDRVRERLIGGMEPYDLIFMDIYMPAMDGLEAASHIAGMGVPTPLIAMTANIMAGEVEQYKKRGMPDCLGKPFTPRELWRILLKHMTPISETGAPDPYDRDNDFQKVMRDSFVKANRNKYAEISEAMDAGDIARAHRLVHSLKGNAGMIGRDALRDIAADLETLLQRAVPPLPEIRLDALKTELESTLAELDGILGAVPPPDE